MNEFGLIEKYLRPLARKHKGAFDLTDDAAVFNIPTGFEAVITKDAITENVHFFSDTPAKYVAKKLVRTNLSDLAAMGATPKFYLIAAGFPRNIKESWVKEFCLSLAADQKEFGIVLIGGDTVRAGTLMLSLTMIGWAEKGRVLKRSGAKIGDDLYVSGTIGDAALGLKILKKEIKTAKKDAEFLVHRYHMPEPRIALGRKLIGVANSAIDISDGLVGDLEHIEDCSGVSAEIEIDKIPLSKAAAALLKKNPQVIEAILSGGDDYELLFTASKNKAGKIKALGFAVTRIGSIKKTGKKNKRINLKTKGYNHFA